MDFEIKILQTDVYLSRYDIDLHFAMKQKAFNAQ